MRVTYYYYYYYISLCYRGYYSRKNCRVTELHSIVLYYSIHRRVCSNNKSTAKLTDKLLNYGKIFTTQQSANAESLKVAGKRRRLF